MGFRVDVVVQDHRWCEAACEQRILNGGHGCCCVDSGIIYSVLEFMDGGSLAHILKTHKKLGESRPGGISALQRPWKRNELKRPLLEVSCPEKRGSSRPI